MKKLLKNKKGFTIIELVIVIAVIAILAAVLIPTFATVIEKSHESNARSRAKAAYSEIIVTKTGGSAEDFGKTAENKHYKIEVWENGKVYTFPIKDDGQLNTEPETLADADSMTLEAFKGPSATPNTSNLPSDYSEDMDDVRVILE